VSGEVCTTTGVDGSWALSVIPTTNYGPGATYTVSKEHFSFGRRETGPLAITASGPVALDHLQILATIRDLEVAPPFIQAPLPEPVGGYWSTDGLGAGEAGAAGFLPEGFRQGELRRPARGG
jgi:hypothetical protein